MYDNTGKCVLEKYKFKIFYYNVEDNFERNSGYVKFIIDNYIYKCLIFRRKLVNMY